MSRPFEPSEHATVPREVPGASYASSYETTIVCTREGRRESTKGTPPVENFIVGDG